MRRSNAGTSLIDLIISIGILAVLFGGIYLVYFSIITAIANVNVRSAAATAISQELEMVRNLPYDSVGTAAGIPSGVIPQTQTVSVENYQFLLTTTVRNIDDPFDGTLGGSPNDTAPDDYKLVAVDATCPICNDGIDVEITTTVAPKNLESATQNGSLFLYAVDANGDPISGVTMEVKNASVTPSIDLTDTTNVSGVLELVGVPTSTQAYSVVATKGGYSSDQTYSATVSNPNPSKLPLTVAAQTVTAATFSIDQLSQLNVYASDDRCVPIGGQSFSMFGTKLIGTSPNVLKFSTSSATNASGTKNFPSMEWDTYTLQLSNAAENVLGTLPLDPITINPSSTASLRLILQPAQNPALLVTVVDSASGNGIANASTTITKGGFSETLTTDHATISQTDWSGQNASGTSSQSGVDAVSEPGQVTLLVNASGTYATGTIGWLVSNAFDLGGSSSSINSISWGPSSQPPGTGSDSLEFQVAGNNDNTTWSFIGPDGTADTYFTGPGPLPASLAGDRYFRYEAYFSTQDPGFTPELDNVTFDFSADCVPPAQVLFTSLGQGTYTVSASAANYASNSGTVVVGAGYQSSTIELTHL